MNHGDLDYQHLWHPYTKFSTLEAGPLPLITRGKGIYLYDAQGVRYLDAVSSWWACTLGHGEPRIISAIQKQTAELQHSILGNLSHAPAVELAAALAGLMPSPDRHVLFASDGAGAVEAALKIALQYWHNMGRPRPRFASLEDSYHGDTLGSVSVGYLKHFHAPYDSVVFPVYRTAPRDGFPVLEKLFREHAKELAAIIVEPLCQCAAGMKMYPAEYLGKIGELCRSYEVLLIVDEIATGFGRTGTLFAFEQAGIDPDIVCVGKAMSGGYLPISATLVKDEIYKTFSDQPADHTFYHGHTFSGNPIAAAASLAALQVYQEEKIPEKARGLERLFRAELNSLRGKNGVRDVRFLGGIVAVELENSASAQAVRKKLFDKQILIRPLGEVVYLLPPLIIAEHDALELAGEFRQAIERRAD